MTYRYLAELHANYLIRDTHNLRGSTGDIKKIDNRVHLLQRRMERGDYDQCNMLEYIKEDVQQLSEAYRSPFWKLMPQRRIIIRDHQKYLNHINKISEYLNCKNN